MLWFNPIKEETLYFSNNEKICSNCKKMTNICEYTVLGSVAFCSRECREKWWKCYALVYDSKTEGKTYWDFGKECYKKEF